MRIRLDTEPARYRRYPKQIWADGTVIEVGPDVGDGEVPAGILLDDPAWSGALPGEGKLLLGLDVLAQLLGSDHGEAALPHGVHESNPESP